MTRSQLLTVTAAVALVAAAAFVAQTSSYAQAPLIPAPTTTLLDERQAVAREVACPVLQGWFTTHLSVWKTGVKAGRDREVEENLVMMRLILRRLGPLQRSGRCGG